MANDKEKRTEAVKAISPRAPAVYPKLTEVDYGTEKYPIEGGAYSVQQRFTLSDPAVKAFFAKIEKVMEVAEQEAAAKFAALPIATRKKLKEITKVDFFTHVYDADENETGEVLVKFKMKASGKTAKGKEWSRKPQLFDAKRQALRKGTAIWGGSEIRVSCGILPYFVDGNGTFGVSLQLEGVQVIELVSAGGRSASDMGFEDEEGYEQGEQFDDETDDSADDGDTTDTSDSKDVAGKDDF